MSEHDHERGHDKLSKVDSENCKSECTVKKFLTDNIVLVVLCMIALCVYVYSISNNSKEIDKLVISEKSHEERIQIAEKMLVKIDYIQQDVNDIRYDLRDIKNVIIKPTEQVANSDYSQ